MSREGEVQRPLLPRDREHRRAQTKVMGERGAGCSLVGVLFRSHLLLKRVPGGELGPSGALDEGVFGAPRRRKRGA